MVDMKGGSRIRKLGSKLNVVEFSASIGLQKGRVEVDVTKLF